jgi:hypothetical protein
MLAEGLAGGRAVTRMPRMPISSSAPTSTTRTALRTVVFAGGILLIAAASSTGQTAPVGAVVERAPASAASDLRDMRDELRRLHDEVGALRAELVAVRREMDQRRATAPALVPAYFRPDVRRGEALASPEPPNLGEAEAPPLRTESGQQISPEAFEILKAQVEEQAQSKVESLSKMPVRLFGTILSNTVFNSDEANWLENPNLVSASLPGATENGSMTSTLRQSRVGFDVGAIPVGSLKASGTLVMDFFGGVPNFNNGTVMGLPRLIIAYGRLEGDKLGLQVGQDRAMLAPRDPTSLAALSFPLFFRSGNLYLRVPQARVEYRPNDAWTFMTGIVAPIAGDFASAYEFAPAAGAGERSKRPAVEGHAGYGRGDADSGSEFALGASGHYGWRRTGGALDKTWAGAVDGNVRVGRIGAAGEWFVVENGEAFGGAVNQAGRAQGGWVEGRVALSSRASVNAGYGLDRPKDAFGRLVRAENRSAFANTIWRLTPELGVSVEYRWLETSLGLVPVTRRNHHVNAVFAVTF